MSRSTTTKALTQAMLKKHCTYNPDTGVFTANHRSVSGKHKKGDVLITRAGKKGYEVAMLNNNYFYLHRLAWMFCYEYMPKKPLEIVHIDGNKKNNSIANLKTVIPESYCPVKTVYKDTDDGDGWVYFSKHRNRWLARIKVNGGNRYLGHFKTKKEAIKVRKQAEQDFGYYKVA